MTGFGKSEIVQDGRRMRVEMKTVNHRFLDISIKSPRFLAFLEEDMRRLVKQRLARGRVDIYVSYASDRDDAKAVYVDMPLAQAYAQAAGQIAGQTGMENDVAVSHILRMPDVVGYDEQETDEQALRDLLAESLGEAISALLKSRGKEGAVLAADIEKRLELLQQCAAGIKEIAGTVVLEYKQKLDERLKELTDGAGIDEQRLTQEVVIYADRCNITEELVRIKSHLRQMQSAIASDQSQGRNMDFIVQELNREFNTIGSKAQNTGIVNYVITAKGELEKIREQIQNIE